MIIASDFDDVAFDCNRSLIDFIGKRYGVVYGYQDIYTWDLWNIWGCSKEEAMRRILEWYESPEHEEAPTITGSVDAIAELARECAIHIVTARPPHTRERTYAWIERHFPGIFADVHFTGNLLPGGKPKSEVCRELGAAFMIEDSLRNTLEVAAAGIPVLLFDAPWNQGAIPANVTRVSGWPQILETIQSVRA